MMQQHSLDQAGFAENDGSFSQPRFGATAAPMLLQYIQAALRRKWVILGIIASCLAVSVIVTLTATPKYSASTRLEISREQKNVTNVEGLESQESFREVEFYQTQYNLLEARSLAERVARSLRLANNEAFFEAHGSSVGSSGSDLAGPRTVLSRAERESREERAADLLLRGVSIQPVRGSSLVDIAYLSASPQLSADIANAWAQQFIQSSMDRRFASTTDARRFLETRLAELRARLEQSERDLVAYAARQNIVALGATTDADGRTQVNRTLVAADLEALNAELIAATAARIEAEARARQSNGGSASPEALSNSALNVMRQRRAELRAQQAQLLVQFEPQYPAVREVAAQIAAIDASISREEGRISASRSADYQSAVRREAAVRARVDALRGQLANQQRNSIQYNIYQREADTNRQLYDGLLQRYKEIGVAGVGANNIAVVDVATPSGTPASPSLPLNLALGLLGGLVLAGLVTFALEQIDEGLRDPEQVATQLGLPLLGSVPATAKDRLDEIADVKSELAEAYLSVRSNLAFSTDHGVPKSLLITSTRPAEGKSTTSLALATVLGRTGSRVVLIDADMRSPSGHEFLGLSNERGLSNFLAGDDNWRALVQPSNSPGLSFLAAGPVPPSAAELLSSERIIALVRELGREDFDHVIIDAPPILGLADAPLLTRAAEGSIIVVEAGGVSIRTILGSIGRLRAVQAHLIGVVLTKVKRASSGYGYGYGYGYGHGNGLSYGSQAD